VGVGTEELVDLTGLSTQRSNRRRKFIGFGVAAVAVGALVTWAGSSSGTSGTNLPITVAGPIANATCVENNGHVTATGTAATNGPVLGPFVWLFVADTHNQLVARGYDQMRGMFNGSWNWSVTLAIPANVTASCHVQTGGMPLPAIIGNS
jgi:hypothetical protein